MCQGKWITVVLGICIYACAAAQKTGKVDKSNDSSPVQVNYLPGDTVTASNEDLLQMVLQLQKQIDELKKQTVYDRAQVKELERRTIENQDDTLAALAETILLKDHMTTTQQRLTTLEEKVGDNDLNLQGIKMEQELVDTELKECKKVKENLRRAIRKSEKRMTAKYNNITDQLQNLSNEFEEFKNESLVNNEKLEKFQMSLQRKIKSSLNGRYVSLEQLGKGALTTDGLTNQIDGLGGEGSGDAENEFMPITDSIYTGHDKGSSSVEPGSGEEAIETNSNGRKGPSSNDKIYLTVEEFQKAIQDRDAEIASLHDLLFDLEDQIDKVEGRLTSIQLGNFMERLQQSLINFTQNVITLDQWKTASIDIVNSTQINQQKIQSLMSMILNNTNHLQDVEWRITNVQGLSFQQFNLLRMHVIQLNNTVQDIKEDLLRKKQNRGTSNYHPSFNGQNVPYQSQTNLDTVLSRIEELALQIIYHENRISKLEIQALNQSLFECRKFSADLFQDNKISLMERRIRKAEKEIVVAAEMMKRLDVGLYKVFITSQNNSDTIRTVVSDITKLGNFVPLIVEAHREMENFKYQLPKDCDDYYRRNYLKSGVYVIFPFNATQSIRVYCDMEHGVGGWTVIQRRTTGVLGFAVDWNEYVKGFGNVNDEYWLGNYLIYLLTNYKDSSLKIEMLDVENKLWIAQYEHFLLEDDEKYTLSLDGYQGNGTDGLGYCNQMGFSTQDRDNDGSSTHCAMYYMSGWWYKHCHYGNLNGRYQLGMVWYNFDQDEWIQLKGSVMKIKPNGP